MLRTLSLSERSHDLWRRWQLGRPARDPKELKEIEYPCWSEQRRHWEVDWSQTISPESTIRLGYYVLRSREPRNLGAREWQTLSGGRI